MNFTYNFKLKLYKDISVLYNGGAQTGSIGFPQYEADVYTELLWLIYNNGFSLSVMNKYSEVLGYFLEYSAYNEGIVDKLNSPKAFIKAINNCN